MKLEPGNTPEDESGNVMTLTSKPPAPGLFEYGLFLAKHHNERTHNTEGAPLPSTNLGLDQVALERVAQKLVNEHRFPTYVMYLTVNSVERLEQRVNALEFINRKLLETINEAQRDATIKASEELRSGGVASLSLGRALASVAFVIDKLGKILERHGAKE